MSHEQWEELAAGYVLHALDPGQLREFETHLEDCTTCRASVAALTEMAAELAYAAPPAPPPVGLRAGLLDRISAEPQARPLGRSPGRLGRRSTRSGTRLLAVAASIVVLVAGVAAGVTVWRGQREEGQRDRLLRCVEQTRCVAFPLTAEESKQRRGTVVVRGDQVWLLLEDVPRNDPARTRYVLWQLPHTGDPVPMGGFDVTRRTAVTRAFEMRVGADETKALAVTLERGRDVPAAPGSQPVLVAPLPA